MTITVDSVSHADTNNNNITNGLSWSHSISAANTDLFVSLGTDDNATDYTAGLAITAGGVAMTLVTKTATGSGRWRALYRIRNPSTGTPTISVTSATIGVNFVECSGISLKGVDSTTPVRNSNSALGTGTTGSVGVTSVVGDLVLAFTSFNNADTGIVATGGTGAETIQVQHAEAGAICGAIISQAGATSTVTTNWADAAAGNSTWGGIAISVETAATSSPTPTGQAITTSVGTITITTNSSNSVNLIGQAVISSFGTPTVTSNYVGYPITAATALQTTDSAYQSLGFVPADGDHAYWPTIVNSVALTPETSSGNSTGRISSGPQTGVFTLIYYRLSNTTYYNTTVTLTDGTVTSITLTGQQIQSSGGASFVNITTGPILSGAASTTAQGSFSFIVTETENLVGQSITSSPGLLSVSTGGTVSVPISGKIITSGVGTVTASGNATINLPGIGISVGQGAISVTAQHANQTVSLPGLSVGMATSNISAVGNVTVVYKTPNFVEYVLGNTNH